MVATLGVNWVLGALTVLFLFFSVCMILVVLIQRPQGGGLSGAFGAGGMGAGQTAFGAKTGDALTLTTIIVFALWLVMAVGLNLAAKPSGPAANVPAATSGPPADGADGAAANGATDTGTPASGTGGAPALPEPDVNVTPQEPAPAEAPGASPPATDEPGETPAGPEGE